MKNKEHCPSTRSPGAFAILTTSDQRAMVDSLERERAGVGLMPNKTWLTQMEQGYLLETDSLGGNPVLRRQKDDELIRPLSANRNTIKVREERGLIHSGKGRDPLTMVWHTNRKPSWRGSAASCDNEISLRAEGTELRGGSKSLKSTSTLPAKRIGILAITSLRPRLFR